MTTFHRIALSAALLITSSIHLTGLAQPANSPQGGRPMMGSAQMESHREARHQKHLNELKSALQLDSTQENAWHAFSAEMKAPVKRPARPQAAEMEKMTTPERIDKMMAFKSERDAEMNKRITATKTFYASLNPAQQKVFDAHTHKFMKQGPMGHHDKMHP
jgi:protein CpxP